MCINKIRIINKGYRPLDIKTSQFIEVNCNKCIQCESARSAAYAYRFQQEVFDNPDCIPFYVTCTYSPYYRPYLQYFDDNQELHTISVWNRQHVDKFIKILRRQLKYYYGVSSNSLKSLVCCERGSNDFYIDDNGRPRIAQECPHYHLMLVLYNISSLLPIRKLPPSYYDWVKVRNTGCNVRSFFHWLIQDRWFYGNVLDLQVTRSVATCTRYIASYCSKNINENLFDIRPDQIYKYYDKAWENKQADFIHRFSDRINGYFMFDKSAFKRIYRLRKRKALNDGLAKSKFRFKIPVKGCLFFDFIPCRNFVQGLRFARLAPRPVTLAKLQPRSTSSHNIGFHDDPDHLKTYVEQLTSDKLVTLVGSKKSSQIPLPYYYYKKLCKWTYKPPYSTEDNPIAILQYDGISSHWVNTFKISRKVAVWDNVHGSYCEVRYRTYSMSFFTRIGEYVRHKKYRSMIKRYCDQLNTLRSNLSYFTSLLSSFDKLDVIYKRGLWSKYHSLSDISHSLDVIKGLDLRALIKNYVHFSFTELCHLGPVYKSIQVLLNTFSLCKTVHSLLNQLAYRKFFRQRLSGVALQDPELLLPHFINLIPYQNAV